MSIKYIYSDPSQAEVWFLHCDDLIEKEIKKDCWETARSIAFEWADGVCDSLRIRKTRVWKEFKRNLAAIWFGAPVKRVFNPGWTVNEVFDYALNFSDRNVRASLFQENIACHAQSLVLRMGHIEDWKSILENLEQNMLLEVFPESSSNSSICFRRLTSGFCDETNYECGLGQAMNVFEIERGKHLVVSANQLQRDPFTFCSFIPFGNDGHQLDIVCDRLSQLILKHDHCMQLKCFNICRSIGIEWLSIEGYYDSKRKDDLIIVDLDLPFDFVFMRS